MTTSHLDDEQLTALQDGDGPADERAHLDGCARCRARADALATVAALVAAPPPAPPDDAREAALAAALGQADRPVPLRRAPRRRAPTWLAPAAAVVALLALIAVVVPQLGTGGADDDGDSGARATAGTELGDDQRGSRDEAGGGAESAAEDQEQSALVAGVDLGAVDEADELARRVDEAIAAGTATDTTPTAAEPSCAAAFGAVAPPLGPLRLQASVVWRGDPATVRADDERAVVVATEGCAPLATVDLP